MFNSTRIWMKRPKGEKIGTLNCYYQTMIAWLKNGLLIGGDGDKEAEVQTDSEAHWEAVGEAMEADEYLQPRQSSRTATKTTPRELFDDDFESGSEEEIYEEGEYESDGVNIIEE
jgi:hypothetical protein